MGSNLLQSIEQIVIPCSFPTVVLTNQTIGENTKCNLKITAPDFTVLVYMIVLYYGIVHTRYCNKASGHNGNQSKLQHVQIFWL